MKPKGWTVTKCLIAIRRWLLAGALLLSLCSQWWQFVIVQPDAVPRGVTLHLQRDPGDCRCQTERIAVCVHAFVTVKPKSWIDTIKRNYSAISSICGDISCYGWIVTAVLKVADSNSTLICTILVPFYFLIFQYNKEKSLTIIIYFISYYSIFNFN